MDELDKVKDETRLAQDKVDDLEEKIVDKQNEIDDLHSKVGSDATGNTKQKLENARKDIDALEDDLDAAEAVLKRLKRESIEIQDRMDYLLELVVQETDE